MFSQFSLKLRSNVALHDKDVQLLWGANFISDTIHFGYPNNFFSFDWTVFKKIVPTITKKGK